MIAATFLILLGVYSGCGVLFSIPFVLIGLKRLEPNSAPSSWGFRLLILPGVAVFWPLLLRRWFKGFHQPPEERNAHRCAAKSK